MQAPDYYNIIEHPMDLGTMQRNLKTGTYFENKAHFLKELNLIWDNCLTYNTDLVTYPTPENLRLIVESPITATGTCHAKYHCATRRINT